MTDILVLPADRTWDNNKRAGVGGQVSRRILVAVLLSWVSLAGAGINTWTVLGPSGGDIRRLAFVGTSSAVFAITGGGVFRSVDNGATWQPVKTDFANGPTDIAIDPSDSSRVYVLAPDWPSLYTSTNGGLTFSPSVTLPTAVTLAWQVEVSQDGRTLMLSSGARVFRSVDAGQSWSERSPVAIDAQARITALAIDPSDANRAYAAGMSSASVASLWRTQDAGETWEVLMSGSPSTLTVTDIAVSAANPALVWVATHDGLFRSANRGLTWSNMHSGVSMGAVASDPRNADVAYVGSSWGRIYRTADSGASWTNVTSNIAVGQATSIAVDPSNASRVLVGGMGGLHGSNDAGGSWTIRPGIVATSITGLSSDPSTGRIYINASGAGIWYTMPGATSVLPVNNDGLLQLQNGDGAPATLHVTSMLALQGGLQASLSTGLARSSDGGSTWTMVPVAPTGTQQIFSLVGANEDPLTLLAAGNSRLFRSTNGGSLWTQVGGFPAESSFGRMYLAPSDARIAYTSLYRSIVNQPVVQLGIHRSSDAGLTWSTFSSNPSEDPWLLAVDPVSADTLYGTRDTTPATGGLLKSTNAGATWSQLGWNWAESQGAPMALAVDPLRPQTLYAASVARIARSVDGGVTWETLRNVDARPYWSPSVLLVEPGSPGTLLVGTTASSVQKITVAPDLAITGVAPGSPTGLDVPLVFNYTLANRGPFDATGMQATLRWPASLEDVQLSSSTGSCAVEAPGTGACSTDVFRNGSTASLTLTLRSVPAGPIEVQASIAGDQADPEYANNALVHEVTVGPRADMSLTLLGPTSTPVGSTVTYTLTATNAGPNTATAPVVTFQPGTALTSASATTSRGSCTTNASGQVSCTLPNLDSESSVSIFVSATASLAGSHTLLAQVDSPTADLEATDNSTSLLVQVTQVTAPPAGGNSGGGGGGASSNWEIGALLLLALGHLRRRTVYHQR